MRIRSQLHLAAATVALVAASMFGASWFVERQSAAMLRAENDSHAVARDVASLLVLTMEQATYGSERTLLQWHAHYAQLAQTVELALAYDQSRHPVLVELRQNVIDLLPLHQNLVEAIGDGGSALAIRRRELMVERLMSETQELVEARHRWATTISNERSRYQQNFILIVLAAPVGLLLLIAGATVYFSRRMFVPLARVQAAMEAIQHGDLSARCDSAARDEMGDAARAVNAMAASLLAANTSLQGEVAHRRESEERLRLVIDNVPAQIAYIDRDLRYLMTNQPYLASAEGPRADVLGRPVAEVLGPVNFARIQPQLQRALAGETVAFEVELQFGNESRAMQANYVPERDAAGKVLGVFAMVTNVTALRRAEQRLRRVMESSPLGMFVCDNEGLCLYSNPTWQRIAGLTAEQALGHGARGALHPDDRDRVIADWEATIASGAPQISEHRYLRPDGGFVWVRRHMAPLLPDNYRDGLVTVVEDITERRALDQTLAARTAELARSNDELERFAYVASHDLQEPLRMVTSYGQLLVRRHQAQLNTEAQEFLGFMVNGGQRAQALIQDLLSLARVNSQAQPMEPVALDAVLADTLRQLRARIAEADARVTHDPLPTVAADARQIGQLFQNLIGNALKFRGAAAPAIHVGAALEAGHWRISIADNGIGIDPRFFERIFVLFQRLHLRADYEGTGIGLAICKKVVERHGGSIGVQSEPGRGSTFFFTLADSPPIPAAQRLAAA